MNRYESWSIPEVYWKADWEGGICGLLEYGGAEIFTALGPEALMHARRIAEGLAFIAKVFDAHQQEIDEYEDGE